MSIHDKDNELMFEGYTQKNEKILKEENIYDGPLKPNNPISSNIEETEKYLKIIEKAIYKLYDIHLKQEKERDKYNDTSRKYVKNTAIHRVRKYIRDFETKLFRYHSP